MKIIITLFIVLAFFSCKKKQVPPPTEAESSPNDTIEYVTTVYERKILSFSYDCSTFCSDGTLIIAGEQSGKPAVIKVTVTGDIIWSRLLDSIAYISDVVETENGQFMIMACRSTPYQRAAVIRLDANGSEL